MEVRPLTLQEIAATGFTHAIKVTHADLTTAGVAQTLELYSAPANMLVKSAGLLVTTGFTGGSASACVAELGDGGDTDRFMASGSIFAATSRGGTGTQNAYASADTIDLKVTATDDNVVSLDAGELYVFLHLVQLADPGWSD